MRAVGSVEAVVPGQVLAGRFRVEAELGEGGMARVYRVTDLATQRPFALKLLKASIADDKEAVARLRREAEVLSTIDNPAVVRIETYGQLPDGRLFLVIELLEGETLGARMRRDQRMAPEALSPIVAGVAAGLGAAHRAGVVHRDLKPDNVFLATAADGGVQVKILDFGISKVYSNEERLTRTGQVLGTPRYMAPEQLSAEPDLDARTDVYALGVMLYEALAGTPPFVASTPSDLILAILHGKITPLRVMRPELPAELESIVARAMARHRDLRYASPVELAEAWLGLVAPSKTAPRAGMATRLVGSGGLGLASVESEPVAPPAPASGGFRIATFSEAEQHPAPAPPPDTQRLRPAASEPMASRPPRRWPRPWRRLRRRARRLSRRGHTWRSLRGRTPRPSGPHAASAWEPDPSAMSAEAVVLPTRSTRWLWVAFALLAGALTAAGSWRCSGIPRRRCRSRSRSPRRRWRRFEARRPKRRLGRRRLGPMPSEAEAPADLPTAAEPPPRGCAGRGATGRGGARARRKHDAAACALDAVVVRFAFDGARAFGASCLRRRSCRWHRTRSEARAALRSGDARRCLSILDQASLPPSAARLRLEGDCYREAGQGREAVKAYERICELYPSYGDLDAIAAEVERLGGRCR
ncbi:MAG: serine/threonine-protein kinase [Polyangiales bacterium]